MDHAKIIELRQALIKERLKGYHKDCANGARLYVGAAVYFVALCGALAAVVLT
jgi:hypothetical protein